MKQSSNQQSIKNIVFCDFDGTITAIETFVGMLKAFAPQLSAQILPLLYERKITLREGVRKILESIPSSSYPDILTYAKDQPIRPGLAELINFLDSKNIPLVVISGGLKGMVETVLEQHGLLKRVADIWAVEIDTTGEYFQVHSPVEGETELVAKVEVMANYWAQKTIAIGDSVTDINMALKADLVFARDRLIDYMKLENKSYIPWNNFFDVRDYLIEQIQE